METHIKDYIESKRLAWALTTRKTESSRLMKVAGVLPEGPQALWDYCVEKNLGAYSRSTLFVRVGAFVDWMIAKGRLSGPNAFKEWKTEHRRLFKHAYERRIPEISYQDALQRIHSIPRKEVRDAASTILANGLRASELKRIEGRAVRGKGNRLRALYNLSRPSNVSYKSLYRGLRSVGLKPHDLRKVFLNEAIRKGARVEELKELAGWSSIVTADSYIKANNDRLKDIVGRIGDDS